jgi:hypothetical protein
VEHYGVKHEPLENDFSRQSKKYRTQYLEKMEILYGTRLNPDKGLKIESKIDPVDKDGLNEK